MFEESHQLPAMAENIAEDSSSSSPVPRDPHNHLSKSCSSASSSSAASSSSKRSSESSGTTNNNEFSHHNNLVSVAPSSAPPPQASELIDRSNRSKGSRIPTLIGTTSLQNSYSLLLNEVDLDGNNMDLIDSHLSLVDESSHLSSLEPPQLPPSATSAPWRSRRFDERPKPIKTIVNNNEVPIYYPVESVKTTLDIQSELVTVTSHVEASFLSPIKSSSSYRSQGYGSPIQPITGRGGSSSSYSKYSPSSNSSKHFMPMSSSPNFSRIPVVTEVPLVDTAGFVHNKKKPSVQRSDFQS